VRPSASVLLIAGSTPSEKARQSQALSALILLTLVTEAASVMHFVFSGCSATACRIADAIISPAKKSRGFIDHLIGDSEQC